MKIRKSQKRWVAKILVLVMLITCLPMYRGKEAEADSGVYISTIGQVVDSITFNGQVVKSIYAPYRSIANYDSNATYCCAAFIKKFYSAVFGVHLYNLWADRSHDPMGASLSKTSSPVRGDIVKFSGHWAIVKEVNGNNITLIEQNSWTDYSYTKARVNRVINKNSALAFIIMEEIQALHHQLQEIHL